MRISRPLYPVIGVFIPLLLTLAAAASHAAERCETAIARPVSIQGQLEVRHAGKQDWQTATREQAYCPGDALRTGANSRAAIQLYPETIIRLDQSSSIVFAPGGETTPGSTWLELLQGAAHLISRDPRSLKVITPFANAAIEGTEFLVEVATQQTAVTVYEGRVRVESATGDVAVADGEQAIAFLRPEGNRRGRKPPVTHDWAKSLHGAKGTQPAEAPGGGLLSPRWGSGI